MNFLQRGIKLQDKSKKIKILFILSIILLIGILFLGALGLNKNMQKNRMYQFTNKTDYEVILNPNNYFSNDKLEVNHYYIASSIKSVAIYFDYFLKNNTKENVNYSYDITATIKSYADNGTKLVWTKDFHLKNIKDNNEKEIKVNENYTLDYQYYVDYVKSFQEYYNVRTENYLYVKLNVKINDKENSCVVVTIPISENIIEITMKEENAFIENKKQNMDFKKIILFLILVIVTFYLVSKFLFNRDNDEAILKEYRDIIITIQNKPTMNNENRIYLTSLKDLINIVETNHLNIFKYQNTYYTILNNIYYIYHF